MTHSPQFDLIVIGGGINGTGIARDAAMRGLKVLMLEKKDLACGASGANSGMIHGGIRYLRYDRKVTELSSIDSGYIQRIAPHLLFRIPFIFPLTAKDVDHPTLRERFLAYGAEVYFGAYDLYQPHKGGKPSVHLTAKEVYELEPAIRRNLIGGMSMDEWGVDAPRLCVLNALSAKRHGATLLTYAQVQGLLRGQDGSVEGVQVQDAKTSQHATYFGKLIVNVAGAWAPKVAAMAQVKVRMRPGKGVHLTLDRRLSNYGLIATAIDGRQIFVMPHGEFSIIGTTDTDFYGDPDHLTITQDDVSYLLEGIESVVPSIRQARILRAWAGLRTTLYEYGKISDDLSREHAIYDHATQGAKNFFTLIGGKLASYRAQSEELTSLLCQRLGVDRECRTHLEPLPGGEHFPDVADLSQSFRLPESTVARMAYRHGFNATKICELAEASPQLRAPLCACEQITYAEAVYCMREENVSTLEDLRRRCGVGLGPCQGTQCAGMAATLFAKERGLSVSQAHGELCAFLQTTHQLKSAVLDGEELAQEELSRANYLTVGNLDGSYARD